MKLIANTALKALLVGAARTSWVRAEQPFEVEDDKAGQALIDNGSARKDGEEAPKDERQRGADGKLLTGDQVQALANARAEAEGSTEGDATKIPPGDGTTKPGAGADGGGEDTGGQAGRPAAKTTTSGRAGR